MANLRDFATGTVVTPPSPATTGNTATLQTGEAARMPTVLPFYATAHPDNTFPTFFNSEKILVTAVNTSTDVITFTREQGEASAKSIAQGWRISNTVFADDLFTSSLVFDQVPTGTINGTNPTFTLITPATDVVVYKNGVRMQEGSGNDYIFTNNNTITFQTGAIPSTGKVTYDAIIGSQAMISGSNSLIFDETPAGTVNGSTVIFTTARPYIPGSLAVYINGVKQKRGVHFTETTSTTFTMGDAPLAGDDVMVDYQFIASVSGNADTVDGYHASSTPTPGQIMVLNSRGQSGEWWEELGRATLVAAGDTITVSGLPAKKYLMIITNLMPSGVIAPWIRYNNDAGNNYAFRYAVNYSTPSSIASTDGVSIDTGAGASPTLASFTVVNEPTVEKHGFGQSESRGITGAANLGTVLDVAGKWTNSLDAISRVDVVNHGGAGDFAIGSQLIILGHD
jgi:hypothetical protein